MLLEGLVVPAGDAARIAFWIHAYNEALRRLIAERPMRRSGLLELRRFGRPVLEADGLSLSLNQVEHGLLRGNRRPPNGVRPTLREGDPRLALAPEAVDPRIHFALNCGARSCPPIRDYDGGRLGEQLELATRSYLEAETTFDRDACRVRLPGLMRLYAADFGTTGDQLRFAAARLPELATGLEACDRIRVSHARFDWRAAPVRAQAHSAPD